MKKILSIALLFAFAANMTAAVGHTGKYFTVTEHDISCKVGHESLDSTLKHVNKTNMAAFMKRGRISAHKMSDGSYTLRGHVNGLGGGPIFGSIVYWGIKTFAYGTGIVAAGTAVVATGGLAGAATGVFVAAGTAGATAGASLAAAAIGGAALTGEAVAVTTSGICAFGGVAGAAAAIESVAASAGLAAFACPFLP
jgi:hypothetical protein